MHLFRRHAAPSCALLAALLLGACGAGAGADDRGTDDGGADHAGTDAAVGALLAAEGGVLSPGSGAGEPGFPRRVEMPDGRWVELPRAPRRIVPAAAGSVDLVCALVPPERVAALPEQALIYSGLRDPASPYLQRPRFDHYMAEPLLMVQPDLVVAYSLQSLDTTRVLVDGGISVVTLSDPASYGDLRDQVVLLGRLLGVETRAGELLQELDDRVARLAAGAVARRELRVLSYANYGGGGWAAAAETTADEIIRMAGLRNAMSEVGETGHVRIGFEELLVLDPDLLLVGRTGEGELGATGRFLRSEPVLQQLSAVRSGGIIELDSWLFATVSHEMVSAAEQLAARVDAHLEGRR